MIEAQAVGAPVETVRANLDARREAKERFAFGDVFFRRLTLSAALLVLLIFAGVIATLAAGAAPAA